MRFSVVYEGVSGDGAGVVTKGTPLKTLTRTESNTLVNIVCESHGSELTQFEFSDAMLMLFEDVSGFEAMPSKKAGIVINKLWSQYMDKISPKKSTDKPTETAGSTATVNLNAAIIQTAIAEGRKLIADGKSKADAARAIYSTISGESKDVIVAAFVEGATLTEKGALTYWYNCRRTASKAK